MPTRSSKDRKRPADLNQLARLIVDSATGAAPPPPDLVEPAAEKNQAAVELGRLGGKKGGKARAEKLSPERRAEIAKAAAAKRWAKKDEPAT